MHTVVISAQHHIGTNLDRVRDDLLNLVVKEVIPAHLLDEKTIYYFNPCGNFFSLFIINKKNFFRFF